MKINFTKKGELEIINAAGKKTGLKSLDDWLKTQTASNHKDDWIFRVKVEPFELSLHGEKRQIETIDFFVAADLRLDFFLGNALKDNNQFELQGIEKLTRENVGFSENRPNALVIHCVAFDVGITQNRATQDLEINWENITSTDKGLIFSLASPQSIVINNHNFTYDKIFWTPVFCAPKRYDFIIKRLTEWKSAQKPFILNGVSLSFDNWLSVKENGNLYIFEEKNVKRELSAELTKETPFLEEITDWLKLPYRQREKFMKRYYDEKYKKLEDMKNEIENAIKALENNQENEDSNSNDKENPEPKPTSPPDNSPKDQDNSANNKAVISKELKIFLWVGGIIFALLLTFLIYQKLSKKTKKK